MFGFFKRNKPAPEPTAPDLTAPSVTAPEIIAPSPAVSAPLAPVESEPSQPEQQKSTAERASWITRLKRGLSKTSTSLTTLFIGARIDAALYEELESALLVADTGVDATQSLLDQLKQKVKQDKLTESGQVRDALRGLLVHTLLPLEQGLPLDQGVPCVWMIAGVNGAGKTTSIGKLAHLLQSEKKSVLLAAGDTFRAAAREQLAIWGERNNVQVISQQGGDPAAVAFDAVTAGRARGCDIVMIDTAGRLPTQASLMEELKKIKRVIGKAQSDAPHQCLLVLDGNTGQNMLAQVKAFDDAIALTGLIVTKLDGTAKGGAIIALAHARRTQPIPVFFIGVGETMNDLQAFSAHEFADALLG